jgi:hypothetical protein
MMAKGKNLEEQKSTPVTETPSLSTAPGSQSKITPPVVNGYDTKPAKVRSSEIVIILAIVFGCIICGLLAWGFVALIRQFPVWWKNIFGYVNILFAA